MGDRWLLILLGDDRFVLREMKGRSLVVDFWLGRSLCVGEMIGDRWLFIFDWGAIALWWRDEGAIAIW